MSRCPAALALAGAPIVWADAQAAAFFGAQQAAGKGQLPRCRAESEWRQQGLVNFSGILERCGQSEACGPSGLCLTACNSSGAQDACRGYPMVLCTADACKHKGVFQGTQWQDGLMGGISFVLSGLALSAGIGGGGFYVPLLQILLGFTVAESTALSQACLAGGSASVLILNVNSRHPNGHKPLIDYKLMLAMCPFLLVGALFGQLLHEAAPDWLTVSLLTVVLVYSFYTTMVKAVDTFKKEQRERNPPSYTESELASGTSSPTLRGTPTASQQVVAPAPSLPQEPQYPRASLLILLFAWLFLGGSIFARGGPSLDGIFGYCSSGYWALVVGTVTVLVCIGLAGVMWASANSAPSFAMGKARSPALLESQQMDERGQGSALALSGEFEWDSASARKIAVWSIVAGCLAALCGIGGGLVMGPQLLKMGFRAQVQSATTATTLFIMSSTTALFYIAQGAAPVDYVGYLLVCTALGSVVGKSIVNAIVKKYNRPSIVMFLLGILVGGSVVVMFIDGLIKTISDAKAHRNMTFKNMCKVT